MTSSKYDEAIITDAFEEINIRCAGEFEKTDLYMDIIQRQIEKMFISSTVDEAYNGVRQDYRLYPVMLLYKVLLELGRSTGKYSISMTEYRYLVATTKVFEGFLETLLLIKLLRDDENAAPEFEKFRTKFDNRLIQALKQLPTLIIDKDGVSLKPDCIEEVARKVFIFEENPNVFATDDYLSFLGSKKTLFELDKDDSTEDDLEENNNDLKKDVSIDESIRNTDGENVLLYGVPGSGKSWTIEHEYCKPGTQVERLVFHPDYTYSDFIGQILPAVAEDGQVSYKFTPGPFTNILRDAYQNPEKEYVLIIEEINRGNAPAIFGEVFQLLDRKVEIRDNDDDGYPIGTSEYGITNENIAEEMYGKDKKKEKVRIPSNLSIIGTMNTSDQNVFTLDTAFQRRWDMRLIENDFANVDSKLADAEILDTTVTWSNFCIEINKIVVGNSARMTSAEDKRLGAYFVHLRDLQYNDAMGDLKEYDTLRKKESKDSLTSEEKSQIAAIREAMRQNRKFPEKVIKYLWDDAFKFNREVIFETSEYQSLEQVIRAFMYAKGVERFKVFKDNVRDAFLDSEE
ncbi:MAG: AAA family ATPase [Clostridium sp.]|uniref:AAA family ATPase n=1 Tax=Clostridium sp. TaxID=1506 RepID=UPI002A84783F|nr:AAA family ATPase [Clostridium sp.]MDY5097372.1 AAA family ATPase [Clostridium sp.]